MRCTDTKTAGGKEGRKEERKNNRGSEFVMSGEGLRNEKQRLGEVRSD